MKNITLVLFLACSFVFGQETISKKLGEFNELKVYNGLTVELKKSNNSKIEIIGSQADDVVVKNSNGILKVRLKFPESFKAEDVRIVLYYNNYIDVLDANEGGTIISDNTIKQQHLEVKVQEGAKIYLAVKTKHLTVKTVSGGLIELSGSTDNQNIEATTGGIYDGYKLIGKQAIVTAASGANVEIYTTEILDAKVRFGGTIHYKGTPEILKTKKIIGGVIKARN